MDYGILTVIIVLTLVIAILACRKAKTEVRIVILMLAIGIFFYSGFGISYKAVDNRYIVKYAIFLFVLFFAIRIVYREKKSTGIKPNNHYFGNFSFFSNRVDAALSDMDKLIVFFVILFFASYLIQIIYPTNRIMSLFDLTNFTSSGIHARRLEHNSDALLKISDTISTATMPFFFVYLYKCASGTKKKKIKGFILSLMWMWLSFGIYNYLSRYELVVYAAFLFFYIIICKYKRIFISKKAIIIMIALAVISVPFLLSFTSIRLGLSADNLDFKESLEQLIEMECYYPEYYDICVWHSGLIKPISFILWIVFLPVPSVLWPGKPVVQISYSFTSLLTSNSVTSDSYSNELPSILGESFLIFGEHFYWIEAIIIGLIIALFFRLFLKSKKLSLLTVYMLLMLATIGRGGSQSYLSVVINTSVLLIVVLIVKIYLIKPKKIFRRVTANE